MKEYEIEFTNVAFWWSAIDCVCKEHPLITSLTDVNIRSGLSGTNPVFIVDERFLIKFYQIHLFRSGTRNFRVERDCTIRYNYKLENWMTNYILSLNLCLD
jgi:hypothetical protein